MELTNFEIDILKKNESLFDIDLNLGLVGVAESLVAKISVIDRNGILSAMGRILNFLAEDTDLVNEINDRLYEYLVSRLGTDGTVCFGLEHGNTHIFNTKLTVAYLIYKYKVDTLSLPNVEKATPHLFLVGTEARNYIKNVNLPRLKNFDFYFNLLENCDKQNYPSVKITASAALKGRLHNTNRSINVIEV